MQPAFPCQFKTLILVVLAIFGIFGLRTTVYPCVMSQTQLFQVGESGETFIDAILEVCSFRGTGYCESINVPSSIQMVGYIWSWDAGDFGLENLE